MDIDFPKPKISLRQAARAIAILSPVKKNKKTLETALAICLTKFIFMSNKGDGMINS